MKKYAVILAAALGAMMANGYAQQAAPSSQTTAFPFIYSIKYVCGLQMIAPGPNQPPPIEPVVKPGNYATAVNIHNYHVNQASTFRKAIIANGQIGQIDGLVMLPNQAITIDCAQIAKMLKPPLPPFIEGFVEIGSTVQLNVTGVYTAQTCLNPGLDSRCTRLGELTMAVTPPQPAYRDQAD